MSFKSKSKNELQNPGYSNLYHLPDIHFNFSILCNA